MKWITLMSKRRNYPLSMVNNNKLISLRYEYALTKWENGLADTYAVKEDIDENKKKLAKAIENDPFWVEEFMQWAVEQHDKGPNEARGILKENIGAKSNEELACMAHRLFETQAELGKAIIYLEIDTQIQEDIESFLFEKTKDKTEVIKLIERLTAPTRMSAEIKKKLIFLDVLEIFQREGLNKGVNEKVKDLVDEYC